MTAMTGFEASVRKALEEQEDVIDHDEHCSADRDRLASIGRRRGHQVRVTREDGRRAIYTVSELRQEGPDTIVRMGKSGRERIGTSDEFTATVDSQVVAEGLTDEQAEKRGEFVERLRDDGVQAALIVLAPHGGDIERHTDEQAERVADGLSGKPVSVWLCKGFTKEAGAAGRFHITSGDINEECFPALGTVAARRYGYAVAFHGFVQPAPTILVGGAGPYWLKHRVAGAVRRVVAGSGITVRVGRPGEPFNGDDPDNIVNRLTAGGRTGVQLEQTLDARSEYGIAIAYAVAGVYRPLLGKGNWLQRILLYLWRLIHRGPAAGSSTASRSE
jgi:phage replication-related protein YjqB (UPF0714/DUF867 family)